MAAQTIMLRAACAGCFALLALALGACVACGDELPEWDPPGLCPQGSCSSTPVTEIDAEPADAQAPEVDAGEPATDGYPTAPCAPPTPRDVRPEER
jgi:hypothetical protein